MRVGDGMLTAVPTAACCCRLEQEEPWSDEFVADKRKEMRGVVLERLGEQDMDPGVDPGLRLLLGCMRCPRLLADGAGALGSPTCPIRAELSLIPPPSCPSADAVQYARAKTRRNSRKSMVSIASGTTPRPSSGAVGLSAADKYHSPEGEQEGPVRPLLGSSGGS